MRPVLLSPEATRRPPARLPDLESDGPQVRSSSAAYRLLGGQPRRAGVRSKSKLRAGRRSRVGYGARLACHATGEEPLACLVHCTTRLAFFRAATASTSRRESNECSVEWAASISLLERMASLVQYPWSVRGRGAVHPLVGRPPCLSSVELPDAAPDRSAQHRPLARAPGRDFLGELIEERAVVEPLETLAGEHLLAVSVFACKVEQ